jgi:hypothetical protein
MTVHHPPLHAGKSWHTVNISPSERAGRVLIGLAAVVAGIVLLVTAGSVFTVILELLLIAAGLDMVVTGATGHCPLYQKLGRPARDRR